LAITFLFVFCIHQSLVFVIDVCLPLEY
jgi:hypothetical protein